MEEIKDSNKKEIFEMKAVEVYKLVLKGEIKKFPNGFWTQPEAKQNAAKCLKFLIEDILNLSDEEIKNQLSTKFLKKYKLGGMLHICFNDSAIASFENAYPNRFNPWEFKMTSNSYWDNIENRRKAIKWLIEEKLKLTDEELKEQLSKSLFSENGLGGMLKLCFNNSPYDAINDIYQNKFKPWEFKYISNGYWKDVENGAKATKWLIEEKLQLSEEELKKRLSAKIFNDNYLSGMLKICFNGSPYEAINAAYPNKFKPWEFKAVSNGYWKDIDNVKKSIKWLVEEKLNLTDKELKEQLSIKLFTDNGLGGMVNLCFNGSPYEAINVAYPGKFKKEDFKNYR